jgi:two-component system, NarL family, nitrate/nitrite response regulator NarL
VPIRLVIADDHPIVLQGLQRLFESYQDFEVLRSCEDGEQALAAVRSLRPDILLLDLRMPGSDGLDVLRTISAEKLECRTVLLTAAVSDDQVVEAMLLGAMGIVLKESSPEVLIDCVRRVHAGEQCIERDTMTRAFGRALRRESATREAAKTVTPRELEIVRMIGQGLRNKAIAERLFISEGTVKIHLHNVYEKLGLTGRLELALYAQQKGLV